MSSTTRPDPRPDPRNEVVRERKRRGGAVSEFDFDQAKIPEGSSYEWKRTSTVGQMDTGHQLMLAEQGFLPVDASAHPEYMPPGYNGPIVRGDMMLMERPTRLRDQARKEDEARARMQVKINEAQLSDAKPDTFDRSTQVSRTVEPHRAVPE